MGSFVGIAVAGGSVGGPGVVVGWVPDDEDDDDDGAVGSWGC